MLIVCVIQLLNIRKQLKLKCFLLAALTSQAFDLE